MSTKFPCRICTFNVQDCDKSIFCDVCLMWVHISCNDITDDNYFEIQVDDNSDPWCCNACFNDCLPFQKLNIKNHVNTTMDASRTTLNYNQSKDTINFATKTNINNNCPLYTGNCEYFDVQKFANHIKPLNSSKCLSVLHVNIASLRKHIDDFNILLNDLKHKFDIIAIIETRIQDNNAKFNLDGYSFDHMPTKSKCGGVSLFVADSIEYAICRDLSVCVPGGLWRPCS